MGPPPTFWEQLAHHVNTYGLPLIVFTVVSSLLIGFVSHYVLNIRPMKKMQQFEKKQKEEEEEEEILDFAHLQPITNEQKQVGVVKGMINKELVASLRKPLPIDITRNKSADPVPEFVNRKPQVVNHSSSTESASDDDDVVTAQVSGKRRSASLQEGAPISEKDLINTLGNLHGKLATAQLRARTKKMQADMTAEERNDEARTKARQLESIMSLMMQNQEKFGITSEDDIKEQLDMYNF